MFTELRRAQLGVRVSSAARDTRLKREGVMKGLPDTFAGDLERVAHL